jgi:hypothetical protein
MKELGIKPLIKPILQEQTVLNYPTKDCHAQIFLLVDIIFMAYEYVP